MNKQEIIEAINSTIMPNGQKGITAGALANILIEMIIASGGGVTVYVGMVDAETGAVTLTDEQKALNASAFRQIKEGNRLVIVDMSELMSAQYGAQVGMSAVAMGVAHFPPETAALLGMPDEFVTFSSEMVGDVNLLADGTIEIMMPE
jgi:2-methylisocitrate lyase-like PEP mutase family enzyme